ncbi:MAG: nicotinate-nucleotide--dimethylbenzimidazole phosphoribosyltransferase [Syntrophobacteraceae bacterium CG2_30_61_12]|nr:MAG: nicotinate-nucleotide--dimethylbenzimidazole phosphoribosyltransferase [Syntrophobacteraceae bacterium CG2_30_61_12]
MKALQELIEQIEPADSNWRERAWERLHSQIRPRGSLGRLEEVAARLAGIQQTLQPVVDRKLIFTMAGDHGVAVEGVSAYPQEVTAQMVFSFAQGWASINVLAKHVGAEVRVVDCGVAAELPSQWPILHRKIAPGTANIAKGPAMPREHAVRGLLLGAQLVREAREAEGIELFGSGDMGIANTTPSTAIIAAFSGRPPGQLTGRGTGIDDAALQHKVRVIETALAVNRPNPDDALEVLTKVGGYEIAALGGALLGAAAARVPLVCDGLIATAGALVACRLVPAAKDYLFVSHRSEEIGHGTMIEMLGIQPLLDLGMRLGEGTGAALAMNLIEVSSKILKDIKTFAEAGVTDTGH